MFLLEIILEHFNILSFLERISNKHDRYMEHSFYEVRVIRLVFCHKRIFVRQQFKG